MCHIYTALGLLFFLDLFFAEYSCWNYD